MGEQLKVLELRNDGTYLDGNKLKNITEFELKKYEREDLNGIDDWFELRAAGVQEFDDGTLLTSKDGYSTWQVWEVVRLVTFN